MLIFMLQASTMYLPALKLVLSRQTAEHWGRRHTLTLSFAEIHHSARRYLDGQENGGGGFEHTLMRSFTAVSTTLLS